MTTDDVTGVGVRVTRSGRWWAIAVPSLPGAFSQCRRLEQVDEFAREAIALASDRPPSEVGEIVIEVEPPTEVASLVAASDDAAERAEAAVRVASDARLAAVRSLHEHGYPTRDIGALLGISHQRVSQLLADVG